MVKQNLLPLLSNRLRITERKKTDSLQEECLQQDGHSVNAASEPNSPLQNSRNGIFNWSKIEKLCCLVNAQVIQFLPSYIEYWFNLIQSF